MIDIKNVYKIYTMGEEPVHALDGVSLKIEQGDFISIVGQSGSGKSTLMNLIGCLDVPTEGTYELDGRDVSEMTDNELAAIRNKKIGFIFQNFNLIQKLTAVENVELPLIYAGIKKEERREMAMESLERVGLLDRMDHRPNQLSGGQQQRVAIARALASKPPVILADEPTGALDSKSGKEIMDFMKELHRTGHTVIIITHDSGIAQNAQRIVKLQDGKISSDSAVEEESYK